MTKKSQPVQRLLHIHTLLSLGRLPNIASLCEELGVDARTIKRDISYMRRRLGAPIKLTRNPLGYHYREPFTLDPSPFEKNELLALALAKQLRQMAQQTPFSNSLENAINKILRLHDKLGNWRQLAHISFRDNEIPKDETESILHFSQILKAIQNNTQLKMRYYDMSRNSESERIVDPQWLYYSQQHWYFLAHCHTRHTLRHFSLARVCEIENLPEPGRKLTHTEIMEYLHNVYSNPGAKKQQVTIQFDAEAARRVTERFWSSEQQIEFPEGENGPCLLTMQTDSLKLLLHELLPYGQHVRPISPPALVKMMRVEVEGMLRKLQE